MSEYIEIKLRRLVAERSGSVCEYCLIHEDDTHLGCVPDHIISLKHGGATEADNLAYACVFCNRYKGSDIGSILTLDEKFVRFYHPRKDRWSEHFRLDGSIIRPLSEIGEATARILGFNANERIIEREHLISEGAYPSKSALELINNL